MKKFVFMIFCLVFAGAAFADWDPQYPKKWVQYPLMDSRAIGIAESGSKLADDWKCSQQGPVSDIHIWGAAEEGEYDDIAAISFKLSIYSNDTSGDYSKPGTELWTATMLPTAVVSVADNKNMGWYVPFAGQSSYRPEGVFDVYQYNFTIENPFIQDGSSIYWLGVDFDEVTRPYQFGWMTSIEGDQEGFAGNDDATYALGGWKELKYPAAHGLGGQSIDLAFVITPEPGTMALLGIGGLAVLRRRRKSTA
jgi:hypothetical protein